MNQTQPPRVNDSFSSQNEQIKYKIILVGDTSVGKSNIFMKFVLGQQFDLIGSTKVTMIDFKLKQVIIPEQSQPIKLLIWDTAGQQRYRSIVSTYFKGCHGVLMVFDLNLPASFKILKINGYPLLKKAEHSVILLVGNKSDLQVKINKKQIQQFAKINNMCYIQTSVKRSKNVNQAFIKLASLINSKRHLMEKPKSFYLQQKQHKSKKRNCCLFH